MDHNQSPKSGAMLLITIIIISIITTIILTTQLILIKQSYEATYGQGRNEQTLNNSLANLYDALWWKLRITAGMDNNTGAYKTELTANINNTYNANTFESQTGIVDNNRRAQANFSNSVPNYNKYADIVILLDRSSSMGATSFSTNQYINNCIASSSSDCQCLIANPTPTGSSPPPPVSSCQPMTDVRSGIKKVYKIFGYPEPPTPTPSTAEDISKRDLIRVSEVIFGAVGANPAGIETVTAPAPLIKINEFTPSIYNNFVYKMDYPSGYANLSTAINTASSILQSNPRTGISANSTYYKYIIVITDGLPSAPGESGDPLCNQDYGLLQDTISNEFRNSCPNARSNTKTAFQNAVADSNACMLILAYGPNAFTPHNTLNPHLTDYLNDSNNNLINHVNAQNPGNCDIEIDIHNKGDINSNPALQYIRFADSATSVGDELAAIAGLIDDTITSVTLQEINPQ